MPETADLILGKGVESDWRDMYHNLWQYPESARYMLWESTRSEAAARERMQRTIAFETDHPCCWLVYEKCSGQAIGFAGMQEVSPGVWEEMGIAIGPAFTGRGYGKQILNALTDYARDRMGAREFIACCRTENLPSHGMQMACGFVPHHTEERVDPRNNTTYTMEINIKTLR